MRTVLSPALFLGTHSLSAPPVFQSRDTSLPTFHFFTVTEASVPGYPLPVINAALTRPLARVLHSHLRSSDHPALAALCAQLDTALKQSFSGGN